MTLWYSLLLHDEAFSAKDLLYNPDAFPSINENDLVEIVFKEPFAAQKNTDLMASSKPLILRAFPIENGDRKSLQFVSMARAVGEAFEIAPRKEVCLRKINDPASVRAQYVEVFFRDQYISRGGLWKLKTKYLAGSCVYVGKKIDFSGAYRVKVETINVHGDEMAISGYVDEETKVIYRSESAKFFVFLQMGQEIMDFDANGNTCYEKAMNGFFPELFNRWNGANHVVSIILTSRILFDPTKYQNYSVENESFSFDSEGRPYKDFYHVVLDWETRMDWSVMLPVLKAETEKFMQLMIERNSLDYKWSIDGYPAKAAEGNFLESINLALNMFDRHYIDRDLTRTGLSIMIVTPSNGLFKVKRSLLRLTKQRMIDNGIGMDLMCLAPTPLFAVPLFQVFDDSKSKGDAVQDEFKWRYPHWVECSFYDFPKTFLDQPFPFAESEFKSRCPSHVIAQALNLDQSSAVLQVIPTIEESLNELASVRKTPSFLTMHPNSSHDSLSGGTNLPSSNMRDIDFDLFDEVVMKSDSFSEAKTQIMYPSKSNVTGRASLDDGKSHPTFSVTRGAASVSWDKADASPGSAEYALTNHRSSLESGKNFLHRTSESYRQMSTAIPISRVKSYVSTLKHSGYNNQPSSRSSSPARSANIPTAVKGSSENSPSRTPPKPFNVGSGSLSFGKNSINPCNPSMNKLKMSNYRSRWNFVYLKAIDPSNPEPRTNWKSLTSPASLPLVTDYFPSAEELKENYQEYTYTLFPNEENIFQDSSLQLSEQQLISLLMRELLIQRLSQGFQFVLHDVLEGAMDNDPLEKKIEGTRTYYLSLGHHFHKLTNTGSHLLVQRYVRKGNAVSGSENYRYHVCYSGYSKYVERISEFNCPQVSNYNWNYLDHLAFGYEDELIESLRFWRTRLLLIPMKTLPKNSPFLNETGESLTDEELRILGFLRFVEVFRRCELGNNKKREVQTKKSKSSAEKMLQITSDLKIIFSTFRLSVFVKAEESKVTVEAPSISASSSSKMDKRSGSFSLVKYGRVLQEIPPSTILHLIQVPNEGISFTDRRWHWRMYHKVFIGSDFVDWLINNYDDVETREDAVAYGNRLIDEKLLEHVSHARKFLDGHYFYRIKETVDAADNHADVASNVAPDLSAPIRWFRQKLGGGGGATSSTTSVKSIPSPETPPQTPSVVQCSRRIFIDIEASMKQRSDRERIEWAILHYDTAHNPLICYHIHVHWLVCNSRSMDELFQSWTRRAHQCGFTLVEAPVEPDRESNDCDPFHCPIRIPIVVPPPSDKEIKTFMKQHHGESSASLLLPRTFFLEELLKTRFDFVLDLESDDNFSSDIEMRYTFRKIPTKYTQYVHRSGAAFVQVIVDDSPHFLWSENRLLLSRSKRRSPSGLGNFSSLPSSSEMEIRRVYEALKELCQDEIRIKTFWNEIMRNLTTESGLDYIADDAFVENTTVSLTDSVSLSTNNLETPSNSRQKSFSSPSTTRSGPVSRKNEGGSTTTTIVGFVVPPSGSSSGSVAEKSSPKE